MSAVNLLEPQDLTIGKWIIKYRPPIEEGDERVIFLNHGWTGDERSMWVFANQLPKTAWLFVPRAPYASTSREHGGYSWVADRSEAFSKYSDFLPASRAFADLLKILPNHLDVDCSKITLIGFSQGAAFNFAFTLQYENLVTKLASLAGFFPHGSDKQARQSGFSTRNIFIAHGKQDETVPIEYAQQARQLLKEAGARIEYCESNTGHKLGANCFTQLRSFISD